MCRTTEAREALKALIRNEDSLVGIARELNIAPAHIYNAFKRKNLSPTLEAALVKAGYLAPRPTRTRLAIDCERETRRRFRAEAAAQGMSGEAYLLELMEVFKNEFGY